MKRGTTQWQEAVIFDMDGVLIDSEPFWRKSQIAAFASVGVSLTEQDCASTKGWRIDRVVAHWHERRPWQGASIGALQAMIVQGVIEHIRREGRPLQGVHDAITKFQAENRPLALATSSAKVLIDTVLKSLDLEHAFSVICSAEDEVHGKPHPAVFIRAAEVLGVAAAYTSVIEDSLTGMVAAKAAGMHCVVVPDKSEWHDPRWCLADAKFASLSEAIAQA